MAYIKESAIEVIRYIKRFVVLPKKKSLKTTVLTIRLAKARRSDSLPKTLSEYVPIYTPMGKTGG